MVVFAVQAMAALPAWVHLTEVEYAAEGLELFAEDLGPPPLELALVAAEQALGGLELDAVVLGL